MNKALFHYIAASPTAYHATAHTASILASAGYTELPEHTEWTLEAGKGYFVTRNGSSLIAFRIPKSMDIKGFMMTAAHDDTPGFKVKENGELTDGHYLRMMLEMLCRMKTKTVVITGTGSSETDTGFAGIQKGEGLFSYRAAKRKQGIHGTGDMFSAVFAGAYVLGKDPMEAGELAAGFVERVLDATPNPTPFGAEFETQLPWLWQQL